MRILFIFEYWYLKGDNICIFTRKSFLKILLSILLQMKTHEIILFQQYIIIIAISKLFIKRQM